MIRFESCLKEEIYKYLDIRQKELGIDCYDRTTSTLHSFDEYLKLHGNTKEIDESIVLGWMKTFKDKYLNTSINRFIELRLFLRYLASIKYKVFIPDIPKHQDNYIPYYFSEKEIARIFNLADSFSQFYQFETDFQYKLPIILRLLYSCGLRLSETLNLKVSDVNFDSAFLVMHKTKLRKERYVPLSSEMNDILYKYCMRMKLLSKKDSYLFESNKIKGIPYSKKRVQTTFKKILYAAGILTHEDPNDHHRGPCVHCFRHLFVVNSIKQMGQNRIVIDDAFSYLSVYLGHSSLRDTEKYMKFSSELFPEEMEKFNAYTDFLFPEVTYEQN